MQTYHVNIWPNKASHKSFYRVNLDFRVKTVQSSGQFPGATVESAKYLGLGPICRYAQDLEPMLKCMALKDGPIDFEQPLNYDVGEGILIQIKYLVN